MWGHVQAYTYVQLVTRLVVTTPRPLRTYVRVPGTTLMYSFFHLFSILDLRFMWPSQNWNRPSTRVGCFFCSGAWTGWRAGGSSTKLTFLLAIMPVAKEWNNKRQKPSCIFYLEMTRYCLHWSSDVRVKLEKNGSWSRDKWLIVDGGQCWATTTLFLAGNKTGSVHVNTCIIMYRGGGTVCLTTPWPDLPLRVELEESREEWWTGVNGLYCTFSKFSTKLWEFIFSKVHRAMWTIL